MRNKLLFLFFVLFFTSCSKTTIEETQERNLLDSLSVYLSSANDLSLPYEKRFLFNKKAFDLISTTKNDTLKRNTYFKIANRYFNMQAMDEYKNTTENIITLSRIKKDSTDLAKAYSYLGDFFAQKFISDSSYFYYNKAENLYSKINDNSNAAKALLNKAILQYNESDLIGSEKSAINALKYLRQNDNPEMVYECYNILGVISVDLSEYNKALEYHSKALKVSEAGFIGADYQAKATTLNNIGYLYRLKENNEKAINYFQDALKEKNLQKEKSFLYASLKDNLAYSKFKIRDFRQLPNLFYEALKIRDSLNVISGVIASNINLSEYYAFKNDTLKSIKFAEKSYTLAKKNNRPKDIMLSLKQLSNIIPDKKPIYLEEYLKINDSLQLTERQARNKLARIEYETEELTLEKEQLVEQRKTLIYIGLAIILIGVLIFVIRFQASKNRELRLVQEQQKANEEIYQLMINQQDKAEEVRQGEKKRIAQELHDGVLGKLFGTRMNLGILNDHDDSDSKTKRVEFIDELKTLEQEIREISHDLNSEKSAVFNNFVVMVSNFIETQKTVCKATISLTIDQKIRWSEINNMAKINFYRILQEAFQNINKHASAQNVVVTFNLDNGEIQLEIKDDGIGFSYSKKKKGIGLQNMLSRITNSGGTMRIETEPENGTLLQFRLPLS